MRQDSLGNVSEDQTCLGATGVPDSFSAGGWLIHLILETCPGCRRKKGWQVVSRRHGDQVEEEPFTHILSHCLPPAFKSAQCPNWKAFLALNCLPDGKTWLPFCTFLFRWFHLNCHFFPPASTAMRLEDTGQIEQSCTLSFTPNWKIQHLPCISDGIRIHMTYKCCLSLSSH